MSINPGIFKGYDVRGLYPEEINEDVVYKIAQAYLKVFKPKGAIALGRDVRLSSPSLWQAAAKGLTNAGYDVVDIGTVSTDMLYFAVANYGFGGGMTISASHNPREYNGIKFVREKAIAISADTGIMQMRDEVINGIEILEEDKGEIKKKNLANDYIKHCLSFIDPQIIKPKKVVLDANFGMAGVYAKKMLAGLPLTLIELNCEPDGNFPKGRPDPMISERRQEIGELIRKEKADFGVAWDADADRCFLFDENGEYFDNYFLTAVFVKILLAKSQQPEKIILDPRQFWAVKDAVMAAGATPLMNKVGHAFIKDTMRKENVLFAGEITGHFYFRNNFFCDNGMIPFLLILEELSKKSVQLSEVAKEYREKYFISGEINQTVSDPDQVLKAAEEKYKDNKIDHIDGVSVEFADWRFNLRKSNTEPLIRLNVEAKSQKLVDEKVKELQELIK